ncbi:MAG: hypothetical protein ACP5GI_05315 [Sulfolobales archaeon]
MRCARYRRAYIESKKIIFKHSESFLEISLDEIKELSVEKRYNKILVILTIIIAILTLISPEVLNLIFLIITLSVTLLTKEYILIINLKGNNIYRICDIDKKDLDTLISLFKEITH